MTYPPDDHRDSVRRSPLEHDARIVNGSMLALAAFVIVAVGIAWYALNNDSRTGTASVSPPAAERSVPDGTTGYGGPRPKAPAPKSATP
jgi:hypothetical protein